MRGKGREGKKKCREWKKNIMLHAWPIVLYTKVDAQCEKLATVDAT